MPPSEATCPTPFVFHWWALGTAILYLVEAEHMASDPQNMAILNPIAAAFAGLPVSSLFNWTCRRAGGRVAAALTCVVVLVVAVVGQMKTRNLYVDSYLEMHELGSELAQLADPDDLVISLGLEPIAIYYSGLRGWVFPPPETWHDPDSRLWRDSFERIDAIEHLRLRGASWLLIPMSSYWGDLLIDYLDNHCELVRHSAAGYLYRMMGE